MEKINERIKQGMKLKNMTQAELCRKAQIDKGSLSHYLRGSYEPKQKAIYSMAKALGVSEAWLLGYDVEMSREKVEVSEKFSSLSNEQKKMVNSLINELAGQQKM